METNIENVLVQDKGFKCHSKYECLKCHSTWIGPTGPWDCPVCEHKYVLWVNYQEWRKEHPCEHTNGR